MHLVYNLGVRIVAFLFLIASIFHAKAKLFVAGRRRLIKRIGRELKGESHVWIHSASLGEFEQARPIIERIRLEYPGQKILLTFFSPSGYEVRKDYPLAEKVYYLPWDLPKNANQFVTLVNPRVAIFIKYEFWYNYCQALSSRKIPLLSVSSIFREDQLFFKPYGAFYRNMLPMFSHFFVQNDKSVELLKSLHIGSVTKAGDTRFDRVNQIVIQGDPIPQAERFKGNEKTFVIGSSWEEDIDVLAPFINENYYQMKFIIAPHEITEENITYIEQALQVKSVRFSILSAVDDPDEYRVLIIDNIGMLSRLYRYGEFAYVGGAFGKGLHNILEAACYGVPIFFGDKNYQKYEEANELIMRGGAFEVSDYTDLRNKYMSVNLPENFLLACNVTRVYVEENLGATDKIMKYLSPILS